MAKKSIKKNDSKTVISEKISQFKSYPSDAIIEITLIKKHGVNKIGETIKRHPNTAQVLIDAGIAKN